MDTGVTLPAWPPSAAGLDCPADLDGHGTAPCGLPAVVEYRYPIRSTEGTVDGAKIRCPRGHWFVGPVETLTLAESPDAAVRTSAR